MTLDMLILCIKRPWKPGNSAPAYDCAFLYHRTCSAFKSSSVLSYSFLSSFTVSLNARTLVSISLCFCSLLLYSVNACSFFSASVAMLLLVVSYLLACCSCFWCYQRPNSCSGLLKADLGIQDMTRVCCSVAQPTTWQAED